MIALLGKFSNNCENIIFEAKLKELSVDKCGTSRHCEAGRPVATEGQHCVKILKTSKSHFAIGSDLIELKALHYHYLDLPILRTLADLE